MDDEDDDWDEDEDDGYIPCPLCGATMLEAADYCPSCDQWITHENAPQNRLSWWAIGVILLLIVIMVFSALRF